MKSGTVQSWAGSLHNSGRWLGGCLGMLVMLTGLVLPAQAQPTSAQVVLPDGATTRITGRNINRGDEALILYDRHFGPQTNTNAFGVEVIAVPVPNDSGDDGTPYRVTAVTRVWDCQQDPGLSCGNALIPDDGLVLSATGSKRDLLKTLQPGQRLLLQEDWFQSQSTRISVINPSPLTNPVGSGFPGFRAGNQLIIYDRDFGRPSTGTNEFGFEVTVRNGIVVAQEGSDSAIPEDGYVVSGHGKARNWLIQNAPLGAKLHINGDGNTLTAVTDMDTYVYQFDRRWEEGHCAKPTHTTIEKACLSVREQRDQARMQALAGRRTQAAASITQALENLNRQSWRAYEAFPEQSIRGAWHRPVETSRTAIGKTLDQLQAAGLNTVFLETFFHGYTIFPSQTYAQYGLPTQNPKFTGLDLLQAWTEEAHRRGMKIHVWFQTFYVGTRAFMPPGPILDKYPQWANVQYSALIAEPARGVNPAALAPPVKGKASADEAPLKRLSPTKPVPSTLESGAFFIDPAHPDARAFLMTLIDEIITRYPIDGFQLDYIRYPSSFPSDRYSFHKTTWGYTDIARAQFKEQSGFDPAELNPKDPQTAEIWHAWNSFKTGLITDFVRDAQSHIRQKRPDIQLSAAIFPEGDNTIAVKHQDWRQWARNGWIDFLAPMTLTSAVKVVDHNTRYVVNASQGKVPVFSGIFGPFNNNSAEHVLTQIDTARQAGATGFVLFDTKHLTGRMLEALQAMQTATLPAATSVEAKPQPAIQAQPAPKKPAKKRKRWFSRRP